MRLVDPLETIQSVSGFRSRIIFNYFHDLWSRINTRAKENPHPEHDNWMGAMRPNNYRQFLEVGVVVLVNFLGLASVSFGLVVAVNFFFPRLLDFK